MDNKVGTPTQAIKAGNVEISRNELLSKDAGTMAYEYLEKGDYYNSLEWSNKAIQIDPNNTATWTNKGVGLAELGKYDEAKQYFDRARQLGIKG